MSGFNFNEVFGLKKEVKKRKPVAYHSISAPDKGSTTAASYVRFELVPQYNGLLQYYHDCDLHLRIVIDDTSEDEKFFEQVDDILKKEGTSLRGRYEVVRKA